MLRGFLNAMDTADISGDGEECAARYLCEGAEEAAVRGGMGAAVAEVARWALHLFCPQFHPLPWQRPYHVENTSSRPITEVTQQRAWSVLGWETASEHWVLLSLLHSRVCPDCFSFLPFRSLLCSLNAAEWLSRMDHLTGATNLGEAGNFGIDVALARTHNVSKRFSTCAEKYDGCARLPDSYRDLRPLVLTTSETDLLGVQQDLLVEYVRQKSFSQVPRIAI